MSLCLVSSTAPGAVALVVFSSRVQRGCSHFAFYPSCSAHYPPSIARKITPNRRLQWEVVNSEYSPDFAFTCRNNCSFSRLAMQSVMASHSDFGLVRALTSGPKRPFSTATEQSRPCKQRFFLPENHSAPTLHQTILSLLIPDLLHAHVIAVTQHGRALHPRTSPHCL